MKREELIEVFKRAKANALSVCVEVTIPGQDDTEYIINKPNSLDNKLAYYCKAYDENLVHCMNDKIRIVNAEQIHF